MNGPGEPERLSTGVLLGQKGCREIFMPSGTDTGHWIYRARVFLRFLFRLEEATTSQPRAGKTIPILGDP